MNLARQRCFQHPGREAVARCPECGHSYCRECVTEHRGRVLCRSCLEALTREQDRSRSGWFRGLVNLALGLVGLVLVFYAFQIVGRWLAKTPEVFDQLP